jgi:hypothetical protein
MTFNYIFNTENLISVDKNVCVSFGCWLSAHLLAVIGPSLTDFRFYGGFEVYA